jgi:hypothetical protein
VRFSGEQSHKAPLNHHVRPGHDPAEREIDVLGNQPCDLVADRGD